MTKLIHSFKLALTLAGGCYLFAAPAALAGDMTDKLDIVDSNAVITEATPESRTLTIKAEVEAEVRAAVVRGEYIAVENEDGRVYYNRFIAVEKLPNPELELRKIEFYDYQGRTFTNQIVQVVQ